MKVELIQIIAYYGEKHQKNKAIEELLELASAIYDNDKENVIEEIADVLIMIEQMQLIFGITNDDIQKVKEFKIKRTLERMKNI